jgi:hypothetical protein
MQTFIILACGVFLGFWFGFLTLAFAMAAKKSEKNWDQSN